MYLLLIIFITLLQPPCGSAWTVNHLKSPEEPLLTSYVQLEHTLHQNGYKRSDYSVLVNLRNYFSQLLQDGMCLFVVDNFRNINLILPKIPVILRNPVLLIRSGDSNPVKLYLGIDIPHLHNVSFPENFKKFPCPTSKYFSGFSYHSASMDACLRINFTQYIPHIKPFSCRIHLGIFPPKYVMPRETDWMYPDIFQIQLQNLRPEWNSPAATFPIHILVHLPQASFTIDNFLLYKWLHETQNYDISTLGYSHRIFLIFKVENISYQTPQ